MSFTQFIDIETGSVQAVAEHLAAWHAEQHGVAPGYLGYRLLADVDRANACTAVVDFASAEQAQANDSRPETQAWATKLHELVTNARFRNYSTAATSGNAG